MDKNQMFKNKNLISLFFSNFTITLVGLITGLILAKFASLEVRGEIGKILIWATFGINLITLGTIEYYFSGGINKKLVINHSIFVSVGIFIISLLGLLFYNNGLGGYLYYILILVPINLYSLYRISELNLCGYLTRLSIVKIIQPVTYLLILIFLIIYSELSVEYILWANLISNFMLFIFLTFIPKIEIKEINKIKFDKEWMLVNFSAILSVLISNFDKVYITYKYSLDEVALYLVGLTLIGAPMGLIGQTYAAKFVYGKAKEESYVRTIGVYVGITLSIGMFIYFTAPFFLNILFKDKYNGILDLILVLIVFGFLTNLRLVVIRILRNLGVNKKILNSEIFIIIGIIIILLFSILNIFENIDLFLSAYSLMFLINILYLLSVFKSVSK
ncbi:hypothetical protein [Acinetobacter terrestris]|uniref:Polysaccharide biosynthesis protein n=1 Tax=Acinetobacter terrestris TaxID=2529843 RepID=A0AAW6UWU3_9GAMM|nr:hypothetical protein [Acinetobacter terrestris]MDK1684852.1 hypothetical protein [Acinetobacter terrestris]